jgi:cold shock protein
MNFDRKRRGKGRDKRDGFGDESFDGYQTPSPFQNNYNGPKPGGGGGFGGGRESGGFNGPRRAPGGGGSAMPAQVIGEGKGIVKFFNGQKGFGFIACDERPEDVFVHISAVELAGLSGLAEGQPLGFTLVDRGGKVSATDLVIDGEPMPVTESAPRAERDSGPSRGPREGGREGGFNAPRPQQNQSTGERANGTVKFFNDMKGFGFVQRDDGGEDVFVHISALERSGLGQVTQGERLSFDIEIDRRGKYSATNLSALSE